MLLRSQYFDCWTCIIYKTQHGPGQVRKETHVQDSFDFKLSKSRSSFNTKPHTKHSHFHSDTLHNIAICKIHSAAGKLKLTIHSISNTFRAFSILSLQKQNTINNAPPYNDKKIQQKIISLLPFIYSGAYNASQVNPILVFFFICTVNSNY